MGWKSVAFTGLLAAPDLKDKTKGYIAQQRAGTRKKIDAPLPPGGIPPMKKISAHQAMRHFLGKHAAPQFPWSTAVPSIPQALGLGAALTGGTLLTAGAAKGIGGTYQKFQANRMFEELKNRYPEIRRRPEDSRKYFDMILAYAPGLLRHHAAIGDFLRRQLEYPMSSIEFIKQLADLQATLSRGEAESTASRFGRTTGDVATGLIAPLTMDRLGRKI